MMIYQHINIPTYKRTSMQTYQHTNMQTYHYGDIYCRFYSSFQRKAEQSFPFTKAKQARGFMSAKGQAAAPFPDKSSSRFAASVFIGKTLYPTAPCKRAFENGNDRPATHRPKGKK